MEQHDPNPYLVLLRRELTRAQARLRRCERERDALLAVLNSSKTKENTLSQKQSGKSLVSK